MHTPLFSISLIADILQAKATLRQPDLLIHQLTIDSRTLNDVSRSLFFAIKGHRNGHDFIAHAYEQGLRNFVVSAPVAMDDYPDANFLVVENTLTALQQLAVFRRDQFRFPIIGITGSNGKTIVKEWLFQLLSMDYHIVRSPKSYNSQIGVALSVWKISAADNLGIFEAGISARNEMDSLQAIIKPSIGILTNIGEAHNEGFTSKAEKLTEKLKLFKGVDLLVYSPDYTPGFSREALPGKTKFSWSRSGNADLQVGKLRVTPDGTFIEAVYQQEMMECHIPFTDQAAIENAIICWATLLALGYPVLTAAERLSKLSGVAMRLSLINGMENCSVIDDSYSADSASLAIALDFLNLQNQHPKRTLILSDLYETGKPDAVLYEEIAALLQQKQVNRLIGIGSNLSAMQHLFKLDAAFYPDTESFLAAFPDIHFTNETILVKGARRFEFERIIKRLTLKIHETILEINLNALSHNLHHYRSQLKEGVKTMVMVKAFSYGSGSFEIANLLQYQKVDYLTVAYADEGVALRKAGIKLPVMVMSPDVSAFEVMVRYSLEPELYHPAILKSFINFLPDEVTDCKIHIKLDTGMHRLGFEREDLPELLDILKSTQKVKVESIFTHLVASDEEKHDPFTRQQISLFMAYYKEITDQLTYMPIKHVLNTSGISRWPEEQMDMVRLGIGLYGFDAALSGKMTLQTVATLKTTVTQVKQLKPGETVGYSRAGRLPEGGTIATVKIGYADGYNRKFGYGNGYMLIKGRKVSTIGSICMDMCMLDVTGLNVKPNDEVIVFGRDHDITELARQIDTIPYEILTNVSQRVKRVYFYE